MSVSPLCCVYCIVLFHVKKLFINTLLVELRIVVVPTSVLLYICIGVICCFVAVIKDVSYFSRRCLPLAAVLQFVFGYHKSECTNVIGQIHFAWPLTKSTVDHGQQVNSWKCWPVRLADYPYWVTNYQPVNLRPSVLVYFLLNSSAAYLAQNMLQHLNFWWGELSTTDISVKFWQIVFKTKCWLENVTKSYHKSCFSCTTRVWHSWLSMKNICSLPSEMLAIKPQRGLMQFTSSGTKYISVLL